MVCFQFTLITGAIFLTGMAANPLVGSIAKKTPDIEITWGGWFVAAVVPQMMVAICFGIFSNLMWSITEYALGSTFKCNTLNRIGCCDGKTVSAFERGGARSDHDRAEQGRKFSLD